MGLPRATVQRKATKQEPLSPDASSRVYGITRLIGQVQSMVNESGDPQGFDAAQWSPSRYSVVAFALPSLLYA